jgi:PIN domain nuclease of toxin-antitoxin system
VLLDTHVMLWWLRADRRLSSLASRVVASGENQLLWSIASSWEIAVKIALGKLELERPVHRLYGELVSGQGVEILPIGHDHCTQLAALPLHHRDPFDRMLVAQAQVEGVPVLSADPKLAAYELEVLW